MGWASAIATLLHLTLGIALLLPGALHLLRLWKKASAEGRLKSLLSLLAIGLSLVSAITGVYLTIISLQGSTVAYKHFSSALHLWGSLILVFVYAIRYIPPKLSFRGKSDSQSGGESEAELSKLSNRETQHSPVNSKSGLLLFALPMALGTGALWVASSISPKYSGEIYYRNLTSVTSEQAENRLFPAGLRVETAEGASIDEALKSPMQTSETCGRGGCHPDSYREWSSSAHRFAGSDPFYQEVAKRYKAESGTGSEKWCQGCHTPLTAATGQPDETAQSPSKLESGTEKLVASASIGAVARKQGEGVGCLSCHAMTGTPTRTGNGQFALTVTEDYPFGEEPAGWKRDLHDFLLRVRPAPHQRALLKPELHQSAEFCSSCHRQSFNVAQNHYQFVRGADEYGGWVSGSYSGRVARTNGIEAKLQKTCQDCHFSKNLSGHASHSSYGGNTALPALSGDQTHLDANRNFMQNRLLLDILALRRKPSSPAGQEEWLAPLDNPPPHSDLKPGETVTIDLVITNQGVGHDFPAGYSDLKEAWIEIALTDERGNALLQNGKIEDDKAQLPAGTHFYRTVALNRNGEPILNGERTEQVALAYRKTIPSGGSDIARYRFRLPEKTAIGRRLSGKITVNASIRYRSLQPDFAKRCLGEEAFVPPIVTLATASVSVQLSSVKKQATFPAGSEKRFIRYGNAMLFSKEKPEQSGALRAYRIANLIAPKRPEALIGLGNVYMTEPDLLSAVSQYEAALRLSPENPAARAYLALALNRQGQPDRALQTLQPLSLSFPQDPPLQFEAGLAQANAGDFPSAANAFKRSLAADPDNYGAHFQLQKWSAHLKKTEEAQRELTILSYLGEETLRTQLLAVFLKRHPEESLQLQPIPEHTLSPEVNRRRELKKNKKD